MEELILIQIHPTNPTKIAKIGALLSSFTQEDYKTFLQQNIDVFTWSYKDM